VLCCILILSSHCSLLPPAYLLLCVFFLSLSTSTVGEVDVPLAIELCSDACAVFEDEQRAMFANDTFKAAINYLVKKNKLKEAITMLQRQNKMYLMAIKTFESDLYKNLLSILVRLFLPLLCACMRESKLSCVFTLYHRFCAFNWANTIRQKRTTKSFKGLAAD
jgi:hypothetical protein